MTTEKVNEALDKAHGQSKFKVGDRVVWYDVDGDGCEVRDVGTVVSALRYAVYVRDENDVVLPHHAKALRRLVKKRERRRVWIKCGRHGGLSSLGGKLENPVVFEWSAKSHNSEYVEFIEVRKRGGK